MEKHEAVSPLGLEAVKQAGAAPRLDRLDGKTIGEFWNGVFKGDQTFPVIRKLLKQLSYHEREVLKLSYGLDDGNMYTLEEVGKMFKVSRERIRQVEVGALQKLQLPVRKEKLQAFWEEINQE